MFLEELLVIILSNKFWIILLFLVSLLLIFMVIGDCVGVIFIIVLVGLIFFLIGVNVLGKVMGCFLLIFDWLFWIIKWRFIIWLFKGEFLFDDGGIFYDNLLVDNFGKGSLSVVVFLVGLVGGRREGFVVVVVFCFWFFGNEFFFEWLL